MACKRVREHFFGEKKSDKLTNLEHRRANFGRAVSDNHTSFLKGRDFVRRSTYK